MWTAQNIRQTFFDFFETKDHEIVSSAPMVVKDDPTLMFTNAGMNQFKDVFLGNTKPKNLRVANTQKCLRVSGKHNDLEEVGVDTYHHTMFEMLGNWSFGDYFKKEAIDWAWELLTQVYKIDKERLYATVFEGDKKDGLEKDAEAIGHWEAHLPKDRILLCNKKDNFWEMGEIGPCGPCSEIHVDLRNDEERSKINGATLVNKDHPLVIEIWNLVFIQYQRIKDQSLIDLPKKHIDTGMGFERLCMVLQHQQSNYDTDVFSRCVKELQNISGKMQGDSEQVDIALRVIADHIRAVAFSIADGQLPSNTGAGYVIRRILRRAIRYGYSFLDQKEAFIYKLVAILIEDFDTVFPELKSQFELISKVIHEEEEGFLRTLEKGITRFEKADAISGDFAFELYDTYGFPIDLTQLLASEKNIQVDLEGFHKCLQAQKDRSRSAAAIETEDWTILLDDDQEEFVGYDHTKTTVKITRYRKITTKGKNLYQLVFNITPFYAEGGGQVGDTGYIEANNNKTEITDTKRENNLIVHFCNALPEYLNENFTAVVDERKRIATATNHSATHLMHEALRIVLGEHVQQKGSLVNSDYLRFDFSHFQKLDALELKKVEALVNQRIREDHLLEEKQNTPIEEAKGMGAIALFGEKYGDLVRVIKFGNSVELCGGTHVGATGKIGSFKITHESAIAAGIRRIEAVTANKADEFINDRLDTLSSIKVLLKNPPDVQKAVQDLLKQNTTLSKQIEAHNREKAGSLTNELINKSQEVNGAQLIAERVNLDSAGLKNLAFQLKNNVSNTLIVLGAEINGKANLTVAISDDLIKAKSLNASSIVKELAQEIKGGGGGAANYATAGGKDITGIKRAIELAVDFLT